MHHGPSSQYQLKSQVCLEMNHKKILTLKLGPKDCLRILCADYRGNRNFFLKNRNTIFWLFQSVQTASGPIESEWSVKKFLLIAAMTS